jgi:hypothetical protein
MRNRVGRTQRIFVVNQTSAKTFLKSAFAAASAPDDTNLLTPTFFEGEEIPLHSRREIAQHRLGRRVDMQRWSDQIETRRPR